MCDWMIAFESMFGGKNLVICSQDCTSHNGTRVAHLGILYGVKRSSIKYLIPLLSSATKTKSTIHEKIEGQPILIIYYCVRMKISAGLVPFRESSRVPRNS